MGSSSPYVFGGIISLIVSLTALIIVALLIQNNAMTQQALLAADIALLEQRIALVQNQTPAAVATNALLPLSNALYELCVGDGQGLECQPKVVQETNLANLTAQIQYANETCTNRTSLFVNAVANATASVATLAPNITIVSTGTANVTVGGYPGGSFLVTYVEKRVTIGGEFQLQFVILPAWTSSVPSNGTTVTFTVPLLCHYSDRRPLYDWDAFTFSDGWITGYEKTCGRIIFYLYSGSGSVGTLRQTRDVTLFL